MLLPKSMNFPSTCIIVLIIDYQYQIKTCKKSNCTLTNFNMANKIYVFHKILKNIRGVIYDPTRYE